MKRQSEPIWNTDDGRRLLRIQAEGKMFTVIPAECSRDELRELGEAIADALKHTEEVEKPCPT